MDLNRFKNLTDKLYPQTFNGVPYYLSSSLYSVVTMKKSLGFNYGKFLSSFKDDSGVCCYWEEDLDRIWKIVTEKLHKDKRYLKKIKKTYEKDFSVYQSLYVFLRSAELSVLSDRDLLRVFQQTILAQIDSAGAAHMIEAISLRADEVIKEKLLQVSTQKEFNNYYTKLTSPNQPSFFLKEEQDLFKISKLPKNRQEEALVHHAAKYFWLENSYLGSVELGLKYFKKKMKKVRPAKLVSLKEKELIIKKLRLSKPIIELIKMVQFAGAWQDERKMNILIAVHYSAQVLKEISRRLEIPEAHLNYYTAQEILKLKSLTGITAVRKVLAQRSRGCYIYIEGEKIEFVVGKDFTKLEKILQAAKSVKQEEVRGFVAQPGVVTGKARIVFRVNEFKDFKTGEILITAMTRPEFMPIMRKSAGIVTNEGGITSHAAIVARELGKPCVIGTKIATKIFKTGDLIQVNADHGWVRKM